MEPFDYKCTNCGSRKILSECIARWNVKTQKWDAEDLYYKFCQPCGGLVIQKVETEEVLNHTCSGDRHGI